MKIGIIVAMRKELALLKPMLDNCQEVTVDGFTFHTGRVGSHDVVVMQSGIAKVNAAVGALTLINNFAPQAIVNSGVAGGADPSINVMDVVVGSRVVQHDVYCGAEVAVGAVQGLPQYYEAHRPMLDAIAASPYVKKGLICSGDQFIDTREALDAVKAKFPEALAVDMESGAIAQVCYLRGVPFLSMRVISDSPGASHDHAQQYGDFWAEAPQHTFDMLCKLLHSI